MKINTFFIALSFSFCVSSINAQSVEELAQTAGKGLCDCVNQTYSNIDRDVRDAMMKIIQYQLDGKTAELEQYAGSLSPDLASRLEAQADMFAANDDAFQTCLSDLESYMADAASRSNTNVTADQFTNMIFDSMKKTRGCNFASMLVELGTQANAENGNTNNNSNNGGKTNNDNNNSNNKNNKTVNNKNTNNNSGGDEHGSGGN